MKIYTAFKINFTAYAHFLLSFLFTTKIQQRFTKENMMSQTLKERFLQRTSNLFKFRGPKHFIMTRLKKKAGSCDVISGFYTTPTSYNQLTPSVLRVPCEIKFLGDGTTLHRS